MNDHLKSVLEFGGQRILQVRKVCCGLGCLFCPFNYILVPGEENRKRMQGVQRKMVESVRAWMQETGEQFDWYEYCRSKGSVI
jgi:hypothetical protein